MQKVAVPVLRHRISTNFQAQAEGMTTEDVIARLLQEIPVPEIPKFCGLNRNCRPQETRRQGRQGDKEIRCNAISLSPLLLVSSSSMPVE